MYAGRVVCCPLVSHGEYADGTDRQTDGRTDAKPLHYAFRYGRGYRNKVDSKEVLIICMSRYPVFFAFCLFSPAFSVPYFLFISPHWSLTTGLSRGKQLGYYHAFTVRPSRLQ